MAVTISTIAKHVGLSRQTVAFVLGDRPHLFREETRKRVFAAAEELGYRRNAAAVAMSRGRHNAIGLLESSNTALGFVHPNLLAALMEEVRAAKLHLSLGQVDDAILTDESAMPQLMNDWAVDGLIISYTANSPERLVEILHRFRLPAIWTNVKRPFNAVYPDDYAGARAAVEWLLDLGHRDIAFVRYNDSDHYSSQDRWVGYVDAMSAAGLQPRRLGRHLGMPWYSVECQAERLVDVKRWLTSERPSAVLMDDDTAMPIVVHACAMLGVELGPDLSVVNIAPAHHPVLGNVITTARVPTGVLGHEAIPMLLKKIASCESDVPSIAAPYKFDYLDATCRPPAGRTK